MVQEKTPPIWYWLVGIFALLWNGAGVAAYVAEFTMSAQDFAQLSKVEQDLYAARPFWASAAFAVAVIAGFIGSVMLLLRKPIAIRLLLLSLLAVIVQFSSFFLLDGYIEYLDESGWLMPVAIPIVSLGLYLFVRWADRQQLLR
ncbi:MAG: hypothetical protein ABJO01_15825 [Parasphingorhabdus sp.]|uniref:hypothetical protein n=1 Tax=Parasphingorhabdus sp. TaxID=2709688 RepID=UPI003299D920